MFALEVDHVDQHAWNKGSAWEQVHVECGGAALSIRRLTVWTTAHKKNTDLCQGVWCNLYRVCVRHTRALVAAWAGKSRAYHASREPSKNFGSRGEKTQLQQQQTRTNNEATYSS